MLWLAERPQPKMKIVRVLQLPNSTSEHQPSLSFAENCYLTIVAWMLICTIFSLHHGLYFWRGGAL